jgi:hypothetical protein
LSNISATREPTGIVEGRSRRVRGGEQFPSKNLVGNGRQDFVDRVHHAAILVCGQALLAEGKEFAFNHLRTSAPNS